MARRHARLAALMLIAACAAPGCVSPRVTPGPDSAWSAIALDAEVTRLAASRPSTDALWPGFDPRSVPLAVYDGERTYLFRHPSPPDGFMRLPGADAGTAVMTGRHERVTANSSAEIGGVLTATVLLGPASDRRTLRDVAALTIHEAFHLFQRLRHPGWSGNEVELFTYPTDSVGLLAYRRLETAALRRALDAPDAKGASCHARDALEIRRKRYAGMDSSYAAYERGTELNEGLATYVEQRSLRNVKSDLPAADFPAASIRQRAYATGAALATLLDRLAPDWRATFEANDRETLDGALSRAIEPGQRCAVGADAGAAAGEALGAATVQAQSDIAALRSDRERLRTAFEQRAGWRLIVETGSGEPLWPQRFDPLNVERVDATHILHSRFVALGNSLGKLEVLDASTLTSGVGPHPLFQGVNRVLLTGLTTPELVEADGGVRLTTPGVSLDFRKARIARDGEMIRICVGC
jgi:hypothetical protein